MSAQQMYTCDVGLWYLHQKTPITFIIPETITLSVKMQTEAPNISILVSVPWQYSPPWDILFLSKRRYFCQLNVLKKSLHGDWVTRLVAMEGFPGHGSPSTAVGMLSRSYQNSIWKVALEIDGKTTEQCQ